MRVNFFSTELAADPYPTLARISAAGPVVWNEEMSTWMVTRDDLCRKVLLDFARFRVEGTVEADLFGPDAFISMDDKTRHSLLRGIWAAAFQQDEIARLRDMVRRTTDRLMEPMEERLRAGETVDAMESVCRDLPAYVIAEMLGMPADLRASIVAWSDAMSKSAEAGGDFSAPQWVASEVAKAALAECLVEQIRFRRNHPGDDLISQIVNSEAGATMTETEMMDNCRQLVFAGNETTAKWLGHALVVFANHPDALVEVQADRRLLPAALEEVMRCEPVVHAQPRKTKGEGIELAGVQLEPGQNVSLMFGCANRDPARHFAPDRFDIHRAQKGHLGFGFGLHNCLGATLARLEANVVIDRFIDRFATYRIVAPPDYGNGFMLRGPHAVAVALG